MTLDLFSSLEADVMRAVETSRDPQIFPPFPTRNDFSGKEEATEIAHFPTFPTFPTENEGFVKTGRVDDASSPAGGVSGEDIEGKSAGASSISPAKSGKVGNPCSSKEREWERWEKWEKPVAPIRPADPLTAFEERAADLQYAEGLSRDEAEFLAAEQTGWRPPQRPSNVVALRPADWMPEPSAGVRITAPAVEVDACEYDAHLDALIAALPAGSNERSHLTFAKRKGWVVDRGNERIYTKGRA